VALAAGVLVSPAAAAPALHVIPFPGTPDASPVSRVIFISLPRSSLQSVTVTGTQSGNHFGHFTSLPDGAGTAFQPDRPFTPGETVRVRADLRSPSASTALGDPGASVLRFSFTVAVRPTPPARSSSMGNRWGGQWPTEFSAHGQAPTQSFHSAPGLHPPQVALTHDLDTVSGDIFLNPTGGTDQGGPMILDGRGRLVWFDPIDGPYSSNLQVQRYRSQPVLTWSQEIRSTSGRLLSSDLIMNRSYRIVQVLHVGDGYTFTGNHEFILTPQGTAFVETTLPVKANLTSIGGSPNGSVNEAVIQELDVRTGQVLWEWHELGHVPVSASHTGRPPAWPPYDAFHLNSIQLLPNGNLLISDRNTWAVYEIDKQTGSVIWSLGGRHSSFKMRAGVHFEWQHDAHLVGNTLTLFDDAALPQEERQSSAKVLRLNTTTMTASLVARYVESPPVLASAAGSAQTLPNGNIFVGWGTRPEFSEYTPAGRQIFTGSLPPDVWSYRAYRFPWHAQPLTRPSVAVSPQAGGPIKVFASWNGATQVASWRVLGGARPGALKALARAARSGFETTIAVAGQPRYVAVEALDARGKVLGTSAVRRG
jgi:hypothetical protein